MPLRQFGSLHAYQFRGLDHARVLHAFFTRQGGTSPTPWASLNVGRSVGDDPGRVHRNRRRIFDALGRDPASVFEAWQVHSARVLVAGGPRRTAPLEQGDALLTDNPGVTLFMRFADCVPILLFDARRPAIALIHAGWKGTVGKAAAAAVHAMQDAFGSDPGDLWAGIGPAIGPDHYQVGPEVVARVEKAFGRQARSLLLDVNGGTHMDLWGANRLILEEAGVRTVETAAICTACETRDWYSHRAEAGKTGRFGAVAALI